MTVPVVATGVLLVALLSVAGSSANADLSKDNFTKAFLHAPSVSAALLPRRQAEPEWPTNMSQALVCPEDVHTQRFVRPFCPCTPAEFPPSGACPEGWQCAFVDYSAIPPEQTAPGRKVPTADDVAICVPCSKGQCCPGGSFQPVDGPMALAYRDRYSCRPGHYCPTPHDFLPCPAGSFCPEGSIQPATCNLHDLLQAVPVLPLPPIPRNVRQSVFWDGQPLRGHFCPAKAFGPLYPCERGHFCPNESIMLPCPAGTFCKGYNLEPRPCPWLATCPAKSESADLSLGGFLGMSLILAILWLAYVALSAFIRLQQERVRSRQAASGKLRRLIAPLLASMHADSASPVMQAFGVVKPKISLRFERIGLRLKDGTSILQGVTGRFQHSRVVAIMGPSGAGKSTLLNALMGTASWGVASGKTWVNSRPMPLTRLRSIMGYVPQDDIVHEDLTVRENLAYSARLRGTVQTHARVQTEIVDGVLDLLHLQHVQHSLVGSVEKRGVSGGQRKRVNIGLELVAKPSLLLLDEPTSGLDATAAIDIITALRRMASLGMNIVTVLHQPRFSVYSLFHEVLLLGHGGRTVFLGPVSAALPYFTRLGFELPINENPADFFLDVISGIVPCKDDPAFRPVDLFSMWEQQGPQVASGMAPVTADVLGPDTPSDMSPEQVQLVMHHFDQVDREGTGSLSAEAIRAFLDDAGMQPTREDVRHIMLELDPRREGAVRRYAFLDFIRHGGRMPCRTATSPLTRQRSLELSSDSADVTPLPSPDRQISNDPYPGILPSAQDGRCLPRGEGSPRAAAAADALQPTRRDYINSQHSEACALESQPEEGWLPIDEKAGSHTVFLTAQADHMQPALAPAFSAEALEAEGRFSFSLTGDAEGQAGSTRQRRWTMWRRKRNRYGKVPGAPMQFLLLLKRAGLKWVRGWGHKFVELLLFASAGLVVGAVHGSAWEMEAVRGNTVMSMLTLAVVSTVSALSVFGKDRLMFWRERSGGLHTSAYFFGQTALHLIDILVQPAIFLSLYYTLTLPELSFTQHYTVAALVVWYGSGMGYLMSVIFPPESSLTAAVAAAMVLGGFLNGVQPRLRTLATFAKHALSISYARFSTEAIVILEFSQAPHHMQPRVHELVNQIGYCGLDHIVMDEFTVTEEQIDVTSFCAGYVRWDILCLIAQGLLLRLATYLVLRMRQWQSRPTASLSEMVMRLWTVLLRQSSKRWRLLARSRADKGQGLNGKRASAEADVLLDAEIGGEQA